MNSTEIFSVTTAAKVGWFWYRKAWNKSANFTNTCHSISVSVRKSRIRRTKWENV